MTNEINDQDSKFRSEHADLRHENFSLQDKISRRDQEILRIRDEIYLYRQRVAARKQDVTTRKRDLDSLQIENQRLLKDRDEVNRLLSEEDKSNSKIKSDFDTTQTQNNQLDDDIKQGRERVLQLEGDITASRQAQAEHNSAALTAGRAGAEAADRIYYLKSRKDMFASEHDRADRSMLSLKEVVERYRKEKSDFESERAGEEAKIKSIQGEITTMEGNIRDDMNTIDQIELDKQEVHRNIEYTHNKIADNQTHLNDLRDRESVLERDHASLIREIDLLPKDLRASAEKEEE